MNSLLLSIKSYPFSHKGHSIFFDDFFEKQIVIIGQKFIKYFPLFSLAGIILRYRIYLEH